MNGRILCITVDVDRDANLPIPGAGPAGSLDRGSGTEPRFRSSEAGMRTLMDILDDTGVRATFFFEGRTAETVDCGSVSGHAVGFHGYDHEDLTGESTGVVYSDPELEEVLRRGFDAVSDSVRRPTCFRAPYMACDDRILRKVLGLGIRKDSSFYGRMGETPPVYESVPGMTEYPVMRSKDASGRTIAAYLWPMHEGRRSPEDYVSMASGAGEGPFVLATHSWHMAETREGGLMDPEAVSRNAEAVREVITGILDLGFRPGRM